MPGTRQKLSVFKIDPYPYPTIGVFSIGQSLAPAPSTGSLHTIWILSFNHIENRKPTSTSKMARSDGHFMKVISFLISDESGKFSSYCMQEVARFPNT
eukprot:s812_g2.t1